MSILIEETRQPRGGRDVGLSLEELPERRDTVKSWLLTTDHKRIGILYMISITFFFFIGGAAATLMRLELMTPRGDLLRSDLYNRMFTLHGIVMVFFFMVPSIPAVLGNFFLPMMIGARDLAFPRINLLSWYIYILGGAFTLCRDPLGGRRHRLDVLHALQLDVLEHERPAGGDGRRSSSGSRRS